MPKPKSPDANYFSWCIAYIDAEYIEKVTTELAKYREYREIEAYIPTVKILKKTFKGKQTFENVPLLFNYGFFKIPRKYAIHYKFLDDLKDNISCIFAWIKDPHKLVARNPKLRLNEKAFYSEKEIPIATATSKEISELIKKSFNYSAHSSDEIDRVKPGDQITLHGYPFEGVLATIVEINPKKEVVKVKINIFDQQRDVEVDYDNVFFTMYHSKNYDDSISVKNSLRTKVEPSGEMDNQQFKNFSHE